MTEFAPYLSAADCEYELQSADRRHMVSGHAAWSPSGSFSAVASCSCGWSTTASFGHLARAEALWHLRARHAAA